MKNAENPHVASIFLPYYGTLSKRTQKRQRKEFASLRTFADEKGVLLGDLLAENAGWMNLTETLVQAYLEQLKAQGYKYSSIALQTHTFKHYAYLAMVTGVLSPSAYEAIDAIRIPPGKSEVVYIPLTDEQVSQLLAQPLRSKRGVRDAFCMALLLRCGLWPRSIVALNRSSFDLVA